MKVKRETKICGRCRKVKPVAQFYFKGGAEKGRGWTRYTCKNCERVYKMKQRCKEGEVVVEDFDFEEMFEKQNGICLICKGKATCADHDHKTGKVRGLLCSSCNRGLGMFRDNIKNLQMAVVYLKKS